MTRALRGPSTIWTSTFPVAENPMSQGGIWLNGSTNGAQWTDFQTSSGKAFGTQIGTINSGAGQYNDSTALLNGNFAANQKVTALVYAPIQSANYSAEVEIRLRSAISSGNCTGYEVDYTVQPKDNYLSIVRWEGLLGTFTYLQQLSPGNVNDGDTIMATMSGNLINAYINGVLKASVADSTYASGLPGLGAFISDSVVTGSIANWGFRNVRIESLYSRSLSGTRSSASNRGLAS